MNSEAGMGGAEAVASAPLRSLPRFRGWMPLACSRRRCSSTKPGPEGMVISR